MPMGDGRAQHVIDAEAPRRTTPHGARNSAAVVLRLGQQTAAAELGLRAIAGVSLDDLYADAVALVRDAMEADFVYVVQLRENEQLVRAHVGRTDMNPVGRVLDARNSIADYVVRTADAAVTEDFALEHRFVAPPVVYEASARSAAAVPIHGQFGPFGALIVMNKVVHQFQETDIAFLQTCANVLAAAVDRATDGAALREAQEALTRSQEQLHQAVKMEAVGRLAGGIAHDFNNLLTAIRGYSDLLAAGLRPDDPMRGDVAEIQRAADRAASLTQQLLAFSRRQVLRPARIDLASVVHDFESMIRRLIGEDIDLTVTCDTTRTVLVDRSQIEQVIMNLVINARDAMPSGGQLIIEARDHDVPATAVIRDGSPPPGKYALLRIEDAGSGIAPDVLDRIFEPFFTTKGPGKGTGLGLSTAYGIVKQSGGFIEVTSVQGAGTIFRIYLPEADRDAGVADSGSGTDRASQRAGGETILLVEDADAVRRVVHRALTRMGYNVLEASNGPEAIGVALEHASAIDLLLTDFVMPHMGGRELIDRLHALGVRPRILIMSGYIDDALLRGGGFPSGAAFIEKPFTADRIGRKVREVLDTPAPQVTTSGR
jgi:signal transduction histidine kinase